jgi:hypothetical protein
LTYTWTKERQDQAHAKHKRKALRSLARFIRENEDEILASMDARHEEGFWLYGETMYLWEHAKLKQNIIEELADAATYTASGMARGW